MRKYIGVKMVAAITMSLIAAQAHLGRDVGYKGLTDEDGDCDGYLVEYEQLDNAPAYQTWSPKDVFDKNYRETDGMTFGLAIEALKKGLKVARNGWNGRGMFLELQVPDKHSKMTFPYPYFTIPECKEGTRRIPYAPTIVDIMQQDWRIVE